MKEILNIARTISRETRGVIAGSVALAMYYGHRIPNDLDVWQITPDELTPSIKIADKTVVSQYLTKVQTPTGLNIDVVSPGHPLDRTKYPSVFVSLVRVPDKRDLIANLVQMFTLARPKKTMFYDLAVILHDFDLSEIIKTAWWVYPELTLDQILDSMMNFSAVEDQPNPQTLKCCGSWETVKTTILTAIANLD